MADSRPARDARVLELRVHGVNNTTPFSLLDLPPDAVRLVAGDKLGSFWEPTPDAEKALADASPGERGSIPAGVRREAYSWGGMVRTVPNVGGLSLGGIAAGVVARILYAIVLPFSVGNAVEWSRTLSTPSDPHGVRSRVTAGAGRFFGLLLTLLFTTTAVTLAIDVVAVQCGPMPARCGPIEGLLSSLQGLTEGQRLALLSLVPILAILVLAIFSAVSRMRYDVLPGMELHKEETTLPHRRDGDVVVTGEDLPRFVPKSVLAQPGFWANRVTTYLSRAHIAASIFLTTAFVAGQAATGPWQTWFTCVFWFACGMLLVTVVFVWAVPTMTIVLDPDDAQRTESERSWARIPSLLLVVASVGLLLFALGPLAIAPTWSLEGAALLPADVIPLAIIITGGVLAFTGMWWRKGGRRRATAWWGCAPAVFMSIALTLGVSTSAIVVATTADWLNGAKGPAALIGHDPSASESTRAMSLTWTDQESGATGDVEIGEAVPAVESIRVSSIYVVLGTLLVIALLIALVVILVAAATKRVGTEPRPPDEPPDPADRVAAWGAPTRPGEIPRSEGGVLPPSRSILFTRIRAARTRAAQMHLVEPAAGVMVIGFALALVLALTLLLAANLTDRSVVDLLPWDAVVTNVLNVGMWLLAIVGIALVAALAAGGSAEGARPLGTVWDIACFLPRTGHPFGPPCYAERAVPEIAGHLNQWLQREDRRAVLSAHSMGAVLSVAALGVLASSERTRPVLARISLLTFGVQLRPFFGRMLPELLGPDVLGTHSAEAPRLRKRDPWAVDFAAERARHVARVEEAPPSLRHVLFRHLVAPERPTGVVAGTMLEADLDGVALPTPAVRWVSLWRLTDYLGYPALSTAPHGDDRSWTNTLDRAVDELDTSGYLVAVGTHSEYYRTLGYSEALVQLARRPRP